MKQVIQFMIAFSAIMVIGATASAQTGMRNIDLEAIFNAPANGDSVVNGAGTSVPLQVSVKNNGPDDLVAGDTLFFELSMDNVRILLEGVQLTSDIMAGQTSVVIDSTIDFELQLSPGLVPADICAFVFDDPYTELVYGNTPVSVSYKDPDSTNNRSCNHITINTGGTETSIFKVQNTGEKVTIYPNPTTGIVHIQYPAKVDVALTDMAGRVIRKIKDANSVSLKKLSEGIYLLRITNKNGALIKVAKVIKQQMRQ